MFREMIPGRDTRPILMIILIIFVLLLGFVFPAVAQSDGVTIPLDNIFENVYQQVSPSVVSINVVSRHPDTSFLGQDQTVISGGTGFVLDNDGHILTNNHVVDGATEIEVSFLDGTLAEATIIGLDLDSDLAVLQVDLSPDELRELQPVTFGNSDTLEIGQTVLAIGSPFGQRWTLTSGIISAIGRSIRGLTNFSIGGVIQTDAAINPGNSGGPLLDLEGQVIGVNSQIVSDSRSNAGVGFAIPGNLANRVAQDLIENGFVNYSYLGINGRDVYLPILQTFDLPNDTQGVVVVEVAPGGPASRAGMAGATFDAEVDAQNPRAVPETVEIITAINDEPLSGISELIGYLATQTQPGDTVTLSVLRLNGDVEELDVEVRLTPRP